MRNRRRERKKGRGEGKRRREERRREKRESDLTLKIINVCINSSQTILSGNNTSKKKNI